MKTKTGLMLSIFLLLTLNSNGQQVKLSETASKNYDVMDIATVAGGSYTANGAKKLYHFSNSHPEVIEKKFLGKLKLTALPEKHSEKFASKMTRILKKIPAKALILATAGADLIYAIGTVLGFSTGEIFLIILPAVIFIYLIVISLFKLKLLQDQNFKTQNG